MTVEVFGVDRHLKKENRTKNKERRKQNKKWIRKEARRKIEKLGFWKRVGKKVNKVFLTERHRNKLVLMIGVGLN